MNFDRRYLKKILRGLLITDSPTGFTKNVMEKISVYAEELGFTMERTNRGAGLIHIEGRSEKTVGICVHTDTMGLMVSAVNENGTLSFSPVGSPVLPALDGEYCKIHARNGAVFTGTILSDRPPCHGCGEAGGAAAPESGMYVRIDEKVADRDEVSRLGVGVGDYISIDPKTTITEKGFIKSRFLDDKLSAAAVFGVLKYMKDGMIIPNNNVKIIITAGGEAWRAGTCVPPDISEILAVDMGCVGPGLACTEYDVSICAKDSAGPCDYDMTNHLIQLAQDNKLQYAVDVYPGFASGTGAAWRAGLDARAARIGPGVSGSHGMRRSHFDGVDACMTLIGLYFGFVQRIEK